MKDNIYNLDENQKREEIKAIDKTIESLEDLFSSDVDLIIDVTKRVQQKSIRLDYKKGIIYTSYYLGKTLGLRSQFNEAMTVLSIGFEVAQEHGYTSWYSKFLSAMSYVSIRVDIWKMLQSIYCWL